VTRQGAPVEQIGRGSVSSTVTDHDRADAAAWPDMSALMVPGRDEPRERLAGLLGGFMPFQLVYVMARLQMADLLHRASLTVDELSHSTGTRPAMMRRLLRGLAGIGLVRLERDDRISLTEMGALLRSHAAGSMRDIALHRGGAAFAAWGELEHAVRTGEPAFEAAHGDPFFRYLRDHPEAGAAFDGAMTGLSRGVIDEAIAHYDFAGATRVLDVGGGLGHFLGAVLEAHPELEGAVFDVPKVAEAAAERLRRTGAGDRAAAIGGSFLESVPTGYDVHILKWILHDWNDESCRTLLANCRRALPGDGRLLVVEQLLPDAVPASGSLHPAIAFDLIMLVNFADARERHLAEYEALLESSGFALHRVMALPSGFSILDCRRRGGDAQA
jgi:orsellinic acid C2-O-methyltransferase